MRLQYLVTGTGRCGTVFSARLLTSLGIPCGHEAVFDWHGYKFAESRLQGNEDLKCSQASCSSLVNGKWHNEPKWVDENDIVAESSYMAAPFLDKSILKNVPVIHVVRNPIKVINSFVNYIGYFSSDKPTNRYETFIYRHLPELREQMPPYDRASLYYLLWNELIETKANFFYRIEDKTDSLLNFLDKEGPHYNNVKVNTHAKPSKKFLYEDIQDQDIAQRISDKCKKYGYSKPIGKLYF